jgi:hypothetical protein
LVGVDSFDSFDTIKCIELPLSELFLHFLVLQIVAEREMDETVREVKNQASLYLLSLVMSAMRAKLDFALMCK